MGRRRREQQLDHRRQLDPRRAAAQPAGDLSVSNVALAAHTLTLIGANDVTLATASGTGIIDKNNAGRLDVTGALATGGVTLNANTGTTNIGANETLAALNFGDSDALLAAPSLPVPEPGTWSLLMLGALWCAKERRAGALSAVEGASRRRTHNARSA